MLTNPDSRPIPDELLAEGEPDDLVMPVQTGVQELPFQQLSWKNFERLCLRLLKKDTDHWSCRLYGMQGDHQEGIDIYAFRVSTDKFTVCQCKNVVVFGPSDIKSAAELFLEGDWPAKSDRLILALQDKVNTKKRVDAIADQVKALSNIGIEFEVWDGEDLNIRLKSHPDLVGDFFGQAWRDAFCGRSGEGGPEEIALPTEATEEERRRIRALIEGITP